MGFSSRRNLGRKGRMAMLHILNVLLTCPTKTGGKEDSAQGVGVNVSKVNDALAIAREHFSQKAGL